MSIDELLLADAGLLQAVAIEQGIERAAGALERGIARDRRADFLVAHDQAELADGIVENGPLDHLFEGADMEAATQRLLLSRGAGRSGAGSPRAGG